MFDGWFMSKEDFIKQIALLVQKYAPLYNIRVCSPIIAQAILESASGTSELAVNAHNYFGLKYRNYRCPSSCGIYHKIGSEQNEDGTYSSSSMKWFKFKDIEHGVKGYFDFINISTYKNLKNVTDPETYLQNIKSDGYATSLNYVENLINVIIKYNLIKYDSISPEKYYRVQCGAYKNKSGATKLLKQLQIVGYTPIIKQIDGLYKVQLNAFKNKANAESFLISVKENGFQAFVTYC